MEFIDKAIRLSIKAHLKYSKEPENEFRKWDNQTPYFVHPLWCAMTFLQETKLPESVDREKCVLALLLHDVKEDTTMDLSEWLPKEVINLIEFMTFKKNDKLSSVEIEDKEIWGRPWVIRLLKLYDKTSNLLDGSWMTDEKWNNQYVLYVLKLADDVEKNYGQLNIVRIARTIAVSR